MTAKEIIEAALQDLGIIEAGSSPNFDDLAWCLGKFNRMLNSMSADGINLFYRVSESFAMTSGTASYTIGSSATFDTTRPNVIEQAFIRVDGYDYIVTPRPMDEYWGISDKTTQGRPYLLYYNTTYPNGTIYLYYVPDSSDDLYIVSQKPLTTYSDEDTSVSIPAEYEDTLITRLAMQIAPRYGISVSSELALNAKTAYNNMKARNFANDMKPVELYITGGGGAYDVEAG